MVTVYDVDAQRLISKTAEKIKELGFEYPEWAKFVKTGAHKERPPQNKDWIYTRAAAILRQIYIKGPVGTERLRTKFGGRKNYGVTPEHKVKASGKIIRYCLQQLEKLELLEKTKEGRKISPKGMSLLDNTAFEVAREAK